MSMLRHRAELPDEHYLIAGAVHQMESYIEALGASAIDSTLLRQSIRHLVDYGQDSELYALFEQAIIQAFTNVTYPTDKKQLRRNIGRASTLLQVQFIRPMGEPAMTRAQITKIIALFEHLAQTTNLEVQNMILEEIEREHLTYQARRHRNIQKALGPNSSKLIG